MDTIPSKNLTGREPQDYPCYSCPARSNRNCSQCIFASFNVEGILAAFGKRKSDPTASPLIMNLPNTKSLPVQSAHELNRSLHPHLSKLVVPSHNRIAEVLRQIEHK